MVKKEEAKEWKSCTDLRGKGICISILTMLTNMKAILEANPNTLTRAGKVAMPLLEPHEHPKPTAALLHYYRPLPGRPLALSCVVPIPGPQYAAAPTHWHTCAARRYGRCQGGSTWEEAGLLGQQRRDKVHSLLAHSKCELRATAGG